PRNAVRRASNSSVRNWAITAPLATACPSFTGRLARTPDTGKASSARLIAPTLPERRRSSGSPPATTTMVLTGRTISAGEGFSGEHAVDTGRIISPATQAPTQRLLPIRGRAVIDRKTLTDVWHFLSFDRMRACAFPASTKGLQLRSLVRWQA